jgi:PAS domain-containing protein
MSFKSRLENAKVTELNHLRFSDLLNNLPAAVYVCDAEGYVVSYNEAAATLLGGAPLLEKIFGTAPGKCTILMERRCHWTSALSQKR